MQGLLCGHVGGRACGRVADQKGQTSTHGADWSVKHHQPATELEAVSLQVTGDLFQSSDGGGAFQLLFSILATPPLLVPFEPLAPVFGQSHV